MAQSRLIVMTKPAPAILGTMLQVLRDLELEQRLGSAIFDPENWHQSLSSRYPDEPTFRDVLTRACATVSAEEFTLPLDRITGPKNNGGALHWAFHATRKPKGLTALQSAIRSSLFANGIRDEVFNRAHVTISYRAPSPLETISILPIAWPIEEFQLVRGGGKPYRYEKLESWSLTAAPQVSHQPDFFK